MQTGQMLWGLNSFLLAMLFFFMKSWINSLTKELAKVEVRLDKKLDAITCIERNDAMKSECEKLKHHRHAPVTGDAGGEVIIL